MRLAVHGKPFEQELAGRVAELLAAMAAGGHRVLISQSYKPHLDKYELAAGLPTYPDRLQADHQVDFVFTLGGDGTILDAVTHVGPLEIPIVGVNTGRLGFLATIGLDEAREAIDKVAAGQFTPDKRVLLRLENHDDLFNGTPFALNDFTILKKDTSSMIVVHTYVDGHFLNTYWADGLIVATPTGSTGYSLSCGGPLVLPQSGNFVLTPVSPHNLNVRPLVLRDDSELSFTIDARVEKVLISLDSRSVTIPAETALTVKKEKFKAVLVKFDGYHPFETLRQKLYWGQDVRN